MCRNDGKAVFHPRPSAVTVTMNFWSVPTNRSNSPFASGGNRVIFLCPQTPLLGMVDRCPSYIPLDCQTVQKPHLAWVSQPQLKWFSLFQPQGTVYNYQPLVCNNHAKDRAHWSQSRLSAKAPLVTQSSEVLSASAELMSDKVDSPALWSPLCDPFRGTR